MATTIREFVVELGVDPDTLQVKRFDAALNDAKQTMMRVVEVGAAVTAGVGALGAGLVAAAEKTAKHAVETERQSEAVGMATQKYRELLGVAEKFNIEGDDLQDVLSVLADRAEDAAVRGMESFSEAFEMVGVNVENLESMQPEEIFFRYAEAIRRTDSDMKRLASTERLLGGDLGQRFMPMLQMGEERLREMTRELQQVGAIMEGDASETARQYEHQVWLLNQAWQGFIFTVGEAAIPEIESLIDRLLEWMAANRDLIEQRTEEAVEQLSEAVSAMVEMIPPAVGEIQEMVDALGGWEATLEALGDTLKAAGIAFMVTQFASLASSIGTMVSLGSKLLGFAGGLEVISGQLAIITELGIGTWLAGIVKMAASAAGGWAAFGGIVTAVLGALALALEDVWTFFQGGDSLLGRFIAWFESTEAGARLVEALSETSRELGEIWEEVRRGAEQLWPTIEVALGGALEYVTSGFEMLWAIAKPIILALTRLIGAWVHQFNAVLHLLQGEWDEAWEDLKKSAFETLKAVEDFGLGMLSGLVDASKEFIEAWTFGAVDLTAENQPAPAARSGGGGSSVSAPNPRVAAARQQVRRERTQVNMGKTEVSVEAPPGADEERIADLAAEKTREKEAEQAKKLEELAAGGEK